MRTLLALVAIAFAFGCSSAKSDASGTGGSDAGSGVAIVPGSVQMGVLRAEEQSSIDTIDAAPGRMFASVHFEIANGLSTAITLSPAAFRVSTAAGLEKLASPHSLLLPNACPADAFLATNQVIACRIVFELDQDEQPVSLIYLGASNTQADAGPMSVQTPIHDFLRCSRCSGQCVDLNSDPAHCGACGVTAPSGGSCDSGVPLCPDGKTACGGACVDLSTNPSHCGACFQSSGGASCKDGAPSCPDGWVFGNSQCFDVQNDDANCGQIGHVCSSDSSCFAGKCLSSEASTERKSCAAVCAAVGKQCVPHDDNPSFMYECDDDSLLAFASAPCTVVPNPSTPWGALTCWFDSVYCHCG